MSPEGTTETRQPLSAVVAGVVVLLILVLAGVLGAFVLTRSSGSTDTAADRLPMPGHGYVMPNQIAATASPGRLDVHVGDFWFKASRTTLKAGVYTFAAHNHGVIQHDVMIERMPIKWENGEPADDAAPFGIDGLKPGMNMHTKIALTPGKWELFCSFPGHYASGQHEVITVTKSAHAGHMPTPAAKPMTGMS